MSNSSVSTVSSALVVLTANGDPTHWKRVNANLLKELYPNAAKHIETGINGIANIQDPQFERVVKVARWPITNQEPILSTLTPEELNLPVIVAEPAPRELLIAYADTKWYYRFDRNPLFLGDGGRDAFGRIMKTNDYKREKYLNVEKPGTYAFLERRLAPEIKAKLEIPADATAGFL